MIDTEMAEKALAYLRESAANVGVFTRQAKEKAAQVKHVEALLIKAMDNGKLPVSLRQAYARSDQRYFDVTTEDAIAAGELAQLEAERDTAKIAISLYQTIVKDRL